MAIDPAAKSLWRKRKPNRPPWRREPPPSYRIRRFRSDRPLDALADVPDDFGLSTYFGNAWNVYRGENTYEVKIQFTVVEAEVVTKTVWHKTQEVTQQSIGRVTLKVIFEGLHGIV